MKEDTAPPEIKRCGARTRSGGTCQKPPLLGASRCRLHGGRAGRPPRTGEHSRFFPERILDDLERALGDPGLHSLDFEIAACEARMSQLWRAMEDKNFPPQAWEEAALLWKQAVSHFSGPPPESMRQLGALLAQGADEAGSWKEILELMEMRRRLLQTEVNKLDKLDQFITKRQAAALGAALISVLRRYLPDPNQRDMAVSEVAGLLNRRALPSPR